MLIRKAIEEDARRIAEIHVASWRVAYRGIFPPQYIERRSVDQRHRYWSLAIAQREQDVRAAMLDDKIVGWASYSRDRDLFDAQEVRELTSIYIDPPHWYCGAGKSLLHGIIAELRDTSARTLTVWVLERNHPAVSFYRSSGFHDLATMISDHDGVDLRHLKLQRPIHS